MAFLDNSGDIILDAVLTDSGRQRLARGDGSFKITKFALADDEINYELYRNSNSPDGAHPSGSAWYDIEIMQTPILEAFTNGSTQLKSKLISVARTNIGFLPVIRLAQADQKAGLQPFYAGINAYLITVNKATEDPDIANSVKMSVDGILYGATNLATSPPLRVDQGLDTIQISADNPLDASLIETTYQIEIDNRYGSIVGLKGSPLAASYVDADNIGVYRLSMKSDPGNFVNITPPAVASPIRGPRGSSLAFKVAASVDLATSDFLFNKRGAQTMSVTSAAGASVSVKYIDTTVRVTGVTTGYRIDIPIRFIKSPS